MLSDLLVEIQHCTSPHNDPHVKHGGGGIMVRVTFDHLIASQSLSFGEQPPLGRAVFPLSKIHKSEQTHKLKCNLF